MIPIRPGGRGYTSRAIQEKRKLDSIALPEHLGHKYFFNINSQPYGRAKPMLPTIPQPEPSEAQPRASCRIRRLELKTVGREIWGMINTCPYSWNTLPAFVRKSRIYGT